MVFFYVDPESVIKFDFELNGSVRPLFGQRNNLKTHHLTYYPPEHLFLWKCEQAIAYLFILNRAKKH